MYTFGQQGQQYMSLEGGRRIHSTPWFSQGGVESWNGLDQLHSAIAYQLGGNNWRVPQSVPRSRKRTKAGRYTSDITYEELTKYFHLPTDKACKKLGVGLTILKRLCRKFGLARWPYKRPRKSDKKKSASTDRDDELSKECSQADTVSEEKEKEQVNNTKSDGHRDADEVCKVVQNTNISAHQDKNIQSEAHGVHSMLSDMRGRQHTYSNISRCSNTAPRAFGYIGMPRPINAMEQQERWLSVLHRLGILPIASQATISHSHGHQEIGSGSSAFTRLNGGQISQNKSETAGQARNMHQMQMHLSNKSVAQVETPPASAPTRNLSGYFRSSSITEDMDNKQAEWNSRQPNSAPLDEAVHHSSSSANTRDIKILLQALLMLEQQEARK